MTRPGNAPIVGVDLGGTKISAAAADADAVSSAGSADPVSLLGPIHTTPTPAGDGPAAVLDAAARTIVSALDGTRERAVGIGIGTAGLVDTANHTIVSATEAIRDWVGTDLSGGIGTRLDALGHGRPPIQTDNDVNAHAVGEAVYGSGTDSDSLLLVTVGTGVGAAFVDGSAPRRGAHYGAGEIGHVPTPGAQGRRCPCGRTGHLEAVAAGPAMARRYHQLTGSAAATPNVIGRADAAEPEAVHVVTEAGAALGRALAGLVTTLDPDVVLLGGGVADAAGIWWDTVESTMRAELIDVLSAVPLRPPVLGASAPILGAAHAALAQAPETTREDGGDAIRTE